MHVRAGVRHAEDLEQVLERAVLAADALGALGYDVTVIDPDARFVRRIRELDPDFVFVAMHGRGGEDGTL
ncbi:MAG TPA: hypothetical protein VM824_03465, partial [Thermoleophilaceae bacterium]|nr:hypothetical protein [Thermoleophilaceae bacterium]